MTDSDDATSELATEFKVSLHELLDSVGGGWSEVGLTTSPAGTQGTRWFSAGTPFLVILGVSCDQVHVGRPVSAGPGLAGPATLEISSMSSFHRDDRVLLAAGEAIASAVRAEREHWGFCQGCRQYLPVAPYGTSTSSYCEFCLAKYFAFIAC